MKVLAERFDLPKDLHPEELDAELQEEEDVKPKETKKSKEAPPVEPEQTEAPPGPEDAPPGPEDAPPPTDQPQDPKEILAQIAQMPPAEAIEALGSVFSDAPEILEVIGQIAALPEAEQAAAIQELLGAVSASL
jgi:hypothetical protein